MGIILLVSSQKNQSDLFEQELDDFFKDRALERAQVFSDNSKNKSSKARVENDLEQANFPSEIGSGCCMTGCHDCPWDYQPN
jgi:hypothetical protein